MSQPEPSEQPSSRPDSLARFAEALGEARGTSSRLEKRRILVEYLRAIPDNSLPLAVTFLTGRPFPRSDDRKLSLGGATFSQALLQALPSLTPEELNAAWLRHSDAGDTAADVWERAEPVGEPLTLREVAETFEALAVAKGPTAKVPLLEQAFRRMSAPEIRAFVKVMLSETRMGVQEGTVEDAVAHAFDQPMERVRAANRHRANLGAVALEARHNALEEGGFAYFCPVDPMLAQPTEGVDEVVRRLGTPVWVEDKYDGVRCQLHKQGEQVRLYSRDRKEITRQFPDVVAAFAGAPGSYALDGELMALEHGRSLPFARLQQRLNRIAPTPDVMAAHPAAMVVFDLLACEEESLLDTPLRERRARLEQVVLPPGQLLAPHFTAQNAEELERLFEEAQRLRGNEGLMCKDSGSPYASGRRGYQWLKVKRPLETLDVVIVGAEWGHGKRRAVLSDYTFAVKDEANERLVTIGKAYGGLTDAEIAQMTERLKGITLQEFGRYRTVKPEIVLEVEFNNIQKSARHKSGYALRFPRIVRIRDDKPPSQINTLADVERMYRVLAGEDSGPHA